MDVDRARLDIDILAPDGIEELLAAVDPARPLHQELHQAELGRAEMHEPPVAQHPVGRQVHDQPAIAQHVARGRRLGAPQHGPHARH
jgi:hypothetical protein